MRIFDPLNSESCQPGFREGLPAATGKGLVDWTQFIATKSHGTPLDGLNEDGLNESVVGQRETGTENSLRGTGLLQFLPWENQCRTWQMWSSS